MHLKYQFNNLSLFLPFRNIYHSISSSCIIALRIQYLISLISIIFNDQTEDDLWAALMDAIVFFIKLMKDDIKDIVKEELFPFIQVR